MTTQITQAGITSAVNATNNNGPKVNINQFKIGSQVVPPQSTDVDIVNDLVFTSDVGSSSMQYAIVDANTVEYIITLDESMGPFNVGRIGLFNDSGAGHALFSLTSIDGGPDQKFPSSGNVVGNRLTYSIYLAISNMANIANFTIQLLQLLSIPEVASELILPPPDGVAFNTYQVQKHSFMRVPAIAFRETPTIGGQTPSAWLMGSERLIPGQGEGVIPIIDPATCDASASVGMIIALDYVNGKYTKGDPAIHIHMLGIRTGNEEITNYGFVVVSGSYNPFQRLYAGTGTQAGQIVPSVGGQPANQWYVGYAIKPISTLNANGYLIWIDFTGGNLQEGPQTGSGSGATGATGPAGPGGGGGAGVSNPGQCYLQLVNGLLTLSPYDGNNIIINNSIATIPSTGVVLGSTGLSPNVNYFIYAFMGSGGMVLEASTTQYVIHTQWGYGTKSLDPTRTLVGFARTSASSTWIDGDGSLFVLSWFNKRMKKSRTVIAAKEITTQANSWIEISTDVRNYFLVWNGYNARYSVGGYHGSTGGNGVSTGIAFDDGLHQEPEVVCQGQSFGQSNWGAIGITGSKVGLSEGIHYSTILGVFSLGGAGRGIWRNYTFSTTTTYPAPVSITMTVEG